MLCQAQLQKYLIDRWWRPIKGELAQSVFFVSRRQRPLLLVGVLALPAQTTEQSVQLRDGTGAVSCVLTESDQRGEQSAVFNTAWIGTAPRWPTSSSTALVSFSTHYHHHYFNTKNHFFSAYPPVGKQLNLKSPKLDKIHQALSLNITTDKRKMKITHIEKQPITTSVYPKRNVSWYTWYLFI